MSDWTKTRDAAIAAAKNSLGTSWGIAAGTAVAQISELVLHRPLELTAKRGRLHICSGGQI